MKESISFQLAVQSVLQKDSRFGLQAYAFLCEALNYTVKSLERTDQPSKHVTGQELLVGFREYTLKEFGPLSWLVMQEWGIKKSEHVGAMVYNLIEIGYFGKNESDSIDDFSDGISLKVSLTKPFARKKKRTPRKKSSS